MKQKKWKIFNQIFIYKGLTVSEITAALKQANCNETSQTSSSEVIKLQVNNRQESNSWFSGLFKWIRNLLIAGCFAYTAYKLLIKKYLMTINNNKKSPNQCLQESINEMKNSINALKSTMESINESIQNLKNNVNSRYYLNRFSFYKKK